jgi:ABC-type transport system substrate-binding protein
MVWKLTTLPRAVRGRRRRMLWAATALVLAVGCVACSASSGGTSGAGRGEKRLVWGKPAEADLLDPTLAGSGTASELLNLTYERLVDLDGNLKIVPRLAESWRQTSPTTYEFALRRGVKFSNGRAMTAADVTGTFDRVMDPEIGSLWASQLAIRSVRAKDDAHVTFTLTEPRTSFLAALAASRAAILPMKELRANMFDPKKQLLGTGPFKVVAHSQGESWTLVRKAAAASDRLFRGGATGHRRRSAPSRPDRAGALHDGGKSAAGDRGGRRPASARKPHQ